MMRLTAIVALSVLSALSANNGYSSCIMQSNGSPVHNLNDFISKNLAKATRCPKDVFEFHKIILGNGAEIETTMVANRGFHNPSQGSFSFFEIASSKRADLRAQPGDVFFGHFTGVNSQDQIDLEQTPRRGSLMIEAFAWDEVKGYYN